MRQNRRTLSLAGLLAVTGTLAIVALSGAAPGQADSHDHASHAHAAATSREARLHDGMRSLWEEHVAWTRMAIVSFAAGNADLPETQARLLRNQVHIGNAIKPYYGRAAGNQLTKLLQEHITGAVTLLQAAKAGDDAAVTTARDAWEVNGRQIADFLHRANRRNWPRATMRKMMQTHLDQTVEEAVAQLTGDYRASIRAYDEIEEHILDMADLLSGGIAKQFPRRFR